MLNWLSEKDVYEILKYPSVVNNNNINLNIEKDGKKCTTHPASKFLEYRQTLYKFRDEIIEISGLKERIEKIQATIKIAEIKLVE